MIVRFMRGFDKVQVDSIYKRYFSNNEYPNFLDKGKFPCSFVVSHHEGEIIVAGGVKNIAEAVIVSDQSIPSSTRLDALLQSLGSIINIARDMNHKQVHVFVNDDENYVKVLQKFGFKLLDAKVLVLDIGESHG